MREIVLPAVTELAETHLDILYRLSEDGFITASRDPEVTSPNVHLVRTMEGNRWAIHESERRAAPAVESQFRRLATVADLTAAELEPPGLAPATDPGGFSGEGEIPYRGPAFVAAGQIRPVAEVQVIRSVGDLPAKVSGPLSWIAELPASALPVTVIPDAEGGTEVVSVCHSARSAGQGAEAGVETLPAARGRGFATATVAAWAAAVQAEGRLAFYSTTWDNTASRRIAARLKFQCYGEDVHFRRPAIS